MSKTKQLDFQKLNLDLKNLRMTPQKNEINAIQGMIAISSDRFFAVIDSIIEDGYLNTENVIILDNGSEKIVKEGNRRVAALKLIHKVYNLDNFNIPDVTKKKIDKIDKEWKRSNTKIPCVIYDNSEINKVDKIVSLTHGKGEKAARDQWASIARARHNRDKNGGKEHGLDVLEKYLKVGLNLTAQQKERWSGDYPISVLDETLKYVSKKCGFETIEELAKKYPKIIQRSLLEDILRDVGLNNLGFSKIRDKKIDFTVFYGFPEERNASSKDTDTDTDNGKGKDSSGKRTPDSGGTHSSAGNNNADSKGNSKSDKNGNGKSGGSSSNGSSSSKSGRASKKSSAIGTQANVRNLLRKFNPKAGRPKVATLRDELLTINIKSNPIAFCFILRSIFEISGKAYCKDNSIDIQKRGKDKSLSDILTDVTNVLTSNKKNTAMVKVLHGALLEIKNKDRILSVTSMNQLVHNPLFSVQQQDICTLFGNVYPLLEAMN